MLESLFSLPGFKCNIIALLTDCILYMKGLDTARNMPQMWLMQGMRKKKLDEHRTRAGRTIQSPIVLSDEGDEDENNTGRLSELIALAEAGLQAQEAEDDTDRLSELIALAEAGL